MDGAIPPGYSSGQSITDLKALAAKVLPRGYTIDFSGLSYEEIKAGSLTVYIFLFCIIFVFLFLAALYESWSVPLAVMLAVPISAFGAIVALWCVPVLTNNVYAQIGLITLIGLSAKNAILIVEFAKIRVDRGEDLIMSTLEAAKLRIRPIIMTSMAFILGVMPLVLGDGCGRRIEEYHRGDGVGRNDRVLDHFDLYRSGAVRPTHPLVLWSKRTVLVKDTP